MWSFKFSRCLYLFEQESHLKLRSWVCKDIMCLLQSLLSKNSFGQYWQVNRFSLLWTLAIWFFNSETGFSQISQTGFGLCFESLCCFKWLLLMKTSLQMSQGAFSGLWIFLWRDKVPWLLKAFEHTVHLNDFIPEWIERWDLIVCCRTWNKHYIWPFLPPSAGESFAYDISRSHRYWKPLSICHMASYLIFVTGTTGGACVNFFCPV